MFQRIHIHTVVTLAVAPAVLLFVMSTVPATAGTAAIPADPLMVRACVIGGMTMTGLWDEVAQRFEQKYPFRVKVIATGPRPKIAPPFRRGEADFLVMHSGDITTDLVADGYGINMRPCARNDLVILGPASDPACIRGLKDGAEALRRIARTGSAFLDVNSNGAREIGHTLWRRAGIRPAGDWFIKDSASSSSSIPLFAAERKAYFIFGRMPITQAKVPSANMEILVDQDPTMRRPYVMIEANPARHAHVNHKGAKALSDFFLSTEIQNLMKAYGKKRNGGHPFFYPVWPQGPVMNPVE